MNKKTLYLTLKTAALAAVFGEYFSADTLRGETVAGALAFCCLFAASYLFSTLLKSKTPPIICAVIDIAACITLGAEEYFPLLLTGIFELTDLLDSGGYFYGISGASALLAAMIFRPDNSTLVTAVILTGIGFFTRIAVERVEYFRALSEEQREQNSTLNGKISALKSHAKTLRESAALEERKRFSTRIHDKLGHGISGSIILLEGARMNLKTNPENAEKCIDLVTENLRKSVDEIRAALREERPERAAASSASLREILERFSADYGIKSEFSLEGDEERIPPNVWKCITENLTESLTNTIKHSSASKFSLKIRVCNKIIRAEFSDNGINPHGFTPGLGLEGIEERTALCGGKCLFQCGITGFATINIFEVDL
ncbi:MAG: hypothetical protein K2N06_07375 [Oscillospiraceae bacterium]|nr:hypothetical protein [Oscillospiraceae bacterium]